jgi:peptide/nickel transport system substrate-binding protein
VNPRLARNAGYVFNADKTVTVYGDANFPMDQAQLASLLVPSLQVGAINSGSVLPWEILEALKAIVAESNASHTAYSFNSDNRFTEVDVLTRKTVEDIKAKLQEFIAAKRVPASLQGFVTPAQAAADYQLALAWINRHGHAYISNGGFILDSYDPTGNTGVLAANRDPAYPFAAGYWTKALKLDYSRVDALTVADWQKGKDLKVGVTVSQVAYPANGAQPARNATVFVSLMAGDQETRLAAQPSATVPGLYEVALPARVIDALGTGVYTVVADSFLGGEQSPGVGSTKFMKL